MCNQCEVLVINGQLCHETGCPESYKDETRTCKWCGSEFEPGKRYQQFFLFHIAHSQDYSTLSQSFCNLKFVFLAFSFDIS